MDTETIDNEWLPMTEAASRLGISYRTMYRRIKSGRFQVRTALNGTREVFVPVVATRGDQVADDGDHDNSWRPETTTALALADSVATTCRNQADAARHDLKRVRRLASVLAATLAVVAVGAVLAAWWGRGAIEASEAQKGVLAAQLEAATARTLELVDQVQEERRGAEARIEAMNDQLRQASSQADVMASQLDRAMGDLEHARAERDAAEAIQAATTATWASPAGPAVQVEQGGDEPAPGG